MKTDLGILWLLGSFGTAFIAALTLTHRVRAWSVRLGIMDFPDGGRRLHEQPIPRTGGVAIFASVVIVLVTALLFAPQMEASLKNGGPLLSFGFGAIAIFSLGLMDDLYGLRARTKFLAETIIAAAVWYGGVRIGEVALPGTGLLHLSTVLSLALTVLWLVGITNAFNLIDGSDGVAAGSALFAASAIALVCFLGGNQTGALIALVIAGATLGFLFFNFPPASMFLGDSGSLFLGYSLAAVGIYTVQKAPTVLAISIPVVSCGLPILDTLLAMMRRFLRRESIFNGDRGHIHHRLRDLGHSPRIVALILYAASAGFALLTLLLAQTNSGTVAAGFIVTGAIVWVALQRLGIPELLELRRMVNRGMQQRSVIANNVRIREAVVKLQAACDTSSIAEALAHGFTPGEFHRAEIWFRPESLPLRRPGLLRRQGDGYGWCWNANGTSEAKQLWELNLPFPLDNGGPTGRLSLWGSSKDAHLLTDIRLVALELVPELQRALVRMERELITVEAQPRNVSRRERIAAPQLGMAAARAEKPSAT